MARKSVSQTKQQEDKVEENDSNKRKWKGNHNGSSSQQNKGHKVPRAHTTRPTNKKAYAGSLPMCNQCKFHHNGSCTVKCRNYKKVGHITQNCRTPVAARNQRTHTCYECGTLERERKREEVLLLVTLKCYADEPLVMLLEGIHDDDKLQFVEEPVEIMEREIKRLKRSRIPLVKVHWNSRRGPEFTWERKDSFKQKYLQLFTNRALSSATRKGYQKSKKGAKRAKPERNEETSTRERFEANIESRIKTVVEKSQESKEKEEMRETESLNFGMTIDSYPYLTLYLKQRDKTNLKPWKAELFTKTAYSGISGSIDDVARLFVNVSMLYSMTGIRKWELLVCAQVIRIFIQLGIRGPTGVTHVYN
ncbi:hypothetical protein Tco_0568993 [Tanacetum coccineum]